jgi:hypothetical protein
MVDQREAPSPTLPPLPQSSNRRVLLPLRKIMIFPQVEPYFKNRNGRSAKVAARS